MAEVSPDLFVDALQAYQKTAALKAAIDLDLFTAVAEGCDTVETLASRTRASPRGIRILCDTLTILGFLEKTSHSYRATPSTLAFLDRRSPTYVGSIATFLADPSLIAMMTADPAAFVRNGGVAGPGSVEPENPLWVTFARAMAPLATLVAQAVAQRVAEWQTPPRKVLDIAAGHGMFGITLARAVAGTEILAVDWKPVLAVARENADAAGLGTRYRTLAGSAFDVDWGGGFDLILLPNFLHHFDRPTCVGLLAKVRRSQPGSERPNAGGGFRAERGSRVAPSGGQVRLRDAGLDPARRRLYSAGVRCNGPRSRLPWRSRDATSPDTSDTDRVP
jgi:hypothetical protein